MATATESFNTHLRGCGECANILRVKDIFTVTYIYVSAGCEEERLNICILSATEEHAKWPEMK